MYISTYTYRIHIYRMSQQSEKEEEEEEEEKKTYCVCKFLAGRFFFKGAGHITGGYESWRWWWKKRGEKR
jgi:hypothetical protein